MTILKPVKADTIIRKTYRGIKYTYTPEFAKDLMAVYGLDIESEAVSAIDTCLNIPCVGYNTTYFDGVVVTRKRSIDIKDGKLKIQYKKPQKKIFSKSG